MIGMKPAVIKDMLAKKVSFKVIFVRWKETVMKRFIYTLFLFGAILMSPDSRSEEAESFVNLYTALESVQPGQRLPIALKITVMEGWHTYAKEPGDSGMPPSIIITGPNELKLGEWRFPPPQTFTDSIGTTYGYENQVVLLSEVLIPERIPDGTQIQLTADIKWMICRDICVFKTDSKTLRLRIGSNASAKPSSEWNRLLEESRWVARPGTNE